MRKTIARLTTNGMMSASFLAPALLAGMLSAGALAAPAANNVGSLELTPQVTKLLDDAEKAANAGNTNLALIQLRNAVRLAPQNGEVRGRLGSMLVRTGDMGAAERELRQARTDNAPSDIVVPALLTAMLQRNETAQLLSEFPAPAEGSPDPTAPDVLKARGIALQITGRTAEAKAAIDRSLALRRDLLGLIAGATVAQMQSDLPRARGFIDEALVMEPKNEGALVLWVEISRQDPDKQKALAAAEEFVKRLPDSAVAKILRLDLLLDTNQMDRAKQEVDALVKQNPNSLYGRYYRAVLLARARNFKDAWQQARSLPPEFIQSQPRIALMVAGVAASDGNLESAGAILTTVVTRHPEIREARLQLAAVRLAQKTPKAAIEVLAPLKGSDNAVAHALLGQAYLQTGQLNDAISSLEIASAAPSANDLLKRQLALTQLQAGDANEAVEGLRLLWQRDPSNAEIAAPLMAALGRAQKWDEALAVSDRLAKELPKSPVPSFARAQVLIGRGNLAEAETALTKALTADPKYQAALYYRANVAIARGNPDNAKKDLEQITTINPSAVQAYVSLAQLAGDADQEAEAISWLNKAIKAAGNDPVPRLALANYQISRRKYSDANATLTALQEVSRNNPEALALQGQIQLSQGANADAIKTYRALVAANPTSPGAYELLANALYVTKDQRGAEDAAKKAVELSPDALNAREFLINVQLGSGKPDDALKSAQAYATAKPGAEADLLTVNVLLRANRQKDAEAQLDKSLAAKPDPRLVLRLSQVAFSTNNPKKAVTVLASWVAKNPNDVVVRREYGTALMQTGDLTGARREYEAVLKQHPEDVVVLNNLGWIVQKDDPNRALNVAVLAARIAPRSAEVVDTLGWLKYQRKDTGGALPLLQRAHDIDTANAPISYHLALALDANGRRDEAKTLLQTTLEKNPKFDGVDDAKKVLARW